MISSAQVTESRDLRIRPSSFLVMITTDKLDKIKEIIRGIKKPSAVEDLYNVVC